MDKTTNFPAAEEQDEAISLRNFPLNSDEREKRRSSSEPSEFFEFFHDFTADDLMSNAEDIIFCGKLMPFTNPPRILKSLSADAATARRFSRCHRHSTARRINHELPRRVQPPAAADIRRSSSKSSEKSVVAAPQKPRWFVMMFGPLRMIRPEMDLRDMKSRQVRRNPGRLFASAVDGGGGGRRSFWRGDLLKVLSCNNHASVAVTASVGLVPNF